MAKNKKGSSKKAKTSPVVKVSQYYPVVGSIWKNTIKTDDGKKQVFSVTFQRVYKDNDGDYQHTDGMNKTHCLLLARCAVKCADEIIKLEQKQRDKEKEEEEDEDSDVDEDDE